MQQVMRIGTRESQLAVWQATRVKDLLEQHGYASELVYIKSEGDIDLKTPLYEMGAQGIFTRSLDIALLNNKIDIAVHSMKDVPTQLPKGIIQSAVLKRGSYKDLLVYKGQPDEIVEILGIVDGKWKTYNSDKAASLRHSAFTIATSSVRRAAQWLSRYPGHIVENLRGNVNTRMRKLQESHWDGAIFAAAGLERIGLRPENSIELDWMLPAPAQGAIVVVCREDDDYSFKACSYFNDEDTAICTKIEKDFLRTLAGGCSTPIGAFAEIQSGELIFKGNIFAENGTEKAEIEKKASISNSANLGIIAAQEILLAGGQSIADGIQHEKR
jgi:hydroxymethylbilane synthase